MNFSYISCRSFFYSFLKGAFFMNNRINSFLFVCLLMSGYSAQAVIAPSRWVAPKHTTKENIRDGAIGLGAAYLLGSHLPADRCVRGAAALITANMLMPHFVRRALHRIPVINQLVPTREERIYASGANMPVSRNRELVDMAVLAALTYASRSHINWNTVMGLAAALPAARLLTPPAVRKMLADVPLVRRVVGASELDYQQGLLHRYGFFAAGEALKMMSTRMKNGAYAITQSVSNLFSKKKLR
jgi:hypothetical protein